MLSLNVTSPLAIDSSKDINEMLAYTSWMSKNMYFKLIRFYILYLLSFKIFCHVTQKKRFIILGSLLALGALFGSLSAVYLMDAIGRKATLLAFSVMSLFIGWTLMMAASQIWQLYTGRFLLGLGVGLEIVICPVYISEICRPALRDVCGSFPQVFIGMCSLIYDHYFNTSKIVVEDQNVLWIVKV